MQACHVRSAVFAAISVWESLKFHVWRHKNPSLFFEFSFFNFFFILPFYIDVFFNATHDTLGFLIDFGDNRSQEPFTVNCSWSLYTALYWVTWWGAARDRLIIPNYALVIRSCNEWGRGHWIVNYTGIISFITQYLIRWLKTLFILFIEFWLVCFRQYVSKPFNRYFSEGLVIFSIIGDVFKFISNCLIP